MPNRMPVQRMYTTPNTMVWLDVKGFCVGLVWRLILGLITNFWSICSSFKSFIIFPLNIVLRFIKIQFGFIPINRINSVI